MSAHAWTPEKQRARYYARKAARRCTDCNAGLQDGDGVTCVECTELKRQWARNNRVRRNALSNAYRKRNLPKRAEIARSRYRRAKLLGVCVRCSTKALPDSNFCGPHRERQNARTREQQRRRRATAKGTA